MMAFHWQFTDNGELKKTPRMGTLHFEMLSD